MNDIYAAPVAELRDNKPSDRAGGNIEDAIAGNIDISMTGTMGEAWRTMKGFKLTCHLAFLLYFAAAIIASLSAIPIIFGLIALGADENSAAIIGSLIQIFASIALLPVFIGIHIQGMRHAEGKSTSATSIFGYFNKILVLILCYIILTLMITLGMLLLILPGIYLMYAYMFAMPLAVEKNMSAWRALETSRKAITRVWFRFFGLFFLIMLVNTLAMIPLGIGLIWTLPWSVLTMSMIYTKLFGAEAHTLAD